jgi:TRAP-type C4-dicarboxylate transport system substrate-binding protein
MALCVLLVSLSGCQSNTGDNSSTTPEGETGTQKPVAVIEMKIGGTAAPEHPVSVSGELLCKLINERSGGRINARFYSAQQLGDEPAMLENLQSGLQEGMLSSSETYGNLVKDFNILGMAFAFDSQEHMFKYFESDLGQDAFERLRKNFGIRIIDMGYKKNPRCLFGKKPIKTPDDLKGLKARIPNIPIWEKNFRTMGAIPTITSYADFPMALLQGLVDCGEATYESIYPMKLHQAAPYISLVDYSYPVECFTVSDKFFSSLDEDLQQIIIDSSKDAAVDHSKRIAESWEIDKAKIIEDGAQFIDVDRQVWVDKMVPLAAQLESEGFWDTKGLYEKIQALK